MKDVSRYALRDSRKSLVGFGLSVDAGGPIVFILQRRGWFLLELDLYSTLSSGYLKPNQLRAVSVFTHHLLTISSLLSPYRSVKELTERV